MSAIIQVSCPHCTQAYSMTPEQSGQTVQCTQCQKIFTVGMAQAAVGGAGAYVPMAAPAQLQYSTPSPANSINPLAIISIVCGSVSVCGCMCCAYLSWAPGIAAIVLGIVSLQQNKQTPRGGRPLAITGICLGGVGIMLPFIFVIFGLVMRK